MERDGSVNIYVPMKAAIKVVDTLNDCDVEWDNLITDKLRDLKRYRMAVIPYWILRETGKIIKKHHCSPDNKTSHDELCKYLYTYFFPYALKPTKVPHKDIIDLFFSKLCQKIKECSLLDISDHRRSDYYAREHTRYG
jgi:hypothetical protein